MSSSPMRRDRKTRGLDLWEARIMASQERLKGCGDAEEVRANRRVRAPADRDAEGVASAQRHGERRADSRVLLKVLFDGVADVRAPSSVEVGVGREPHARLERPPEAELNGSERILGACDATVEFVVRR